MDFFVYFVVIQECFSCSSPNLTIFICIMIYNHIYVSVALTITKRNNFLLIFLKSIDGNGLIITNTYSDMYDYINLL